jgi:hypothetical protein
MVNFIRFLFALLVIAQASAYSNSKSMDIRGMRQVPFLFKVRFQVEYVLRAHSQPLFHFQGS